MLSVNCNSVSAKARPTKCWAYVYTAYTCSEVLNKFLKWCLWALKEKFCAHFKLRNNWKLFWLLYIYTCISRAMHLHVEISITANPELNKGSSAKWLLRSHYKTHICLMSLQAIWTVLNVTFTRRMERPFAQSTLFCTTLPGHRPHHIITVKLIL